MKPPAHRPFFAAGASCLLAAVLAAVLAAGVWPQVAAAQAVYRCGADGRTYSDAPCPGGKPVSAGDARSAEQTQAAHAQVQREQALADRMKREREGAERQALAANGRAANMGPSGDQAKAKKAKAEAAAAAKPRKQNRRQQRQAPEGAETWRATVPASPRKPG